MHWTINTGTLADAGIIAEFQMEMARESEGTVLDAGILLEGVKAGLADPSKCTYYLARAEGGEVAGSLMITKEWSDWNNGFYWWVQSVYVRPEYRRQGAYMALYSKMKDLAKKEGAASLRLYVEKDNVNARICYRKQGMSESRYLLYEEKL